jgi:Family of unknown function (DUF5329)
VTRLLRGCTVCLAVVLGASAAAQRPGQGQIDALLGAVATSGCQVERNGELHSANEAEAHLRLKLERAGARVQTAQQFIEHVASGSSVSGKPYRMVCPGQPVLDAQQWLRARL